MTARPRMSLFQSSMWPVADNIIVAAPSGGGGGGGGTISVGDILLLGDATDDYPNADAANPVLVLSWENSGGDWSDAEGADQGATPFATALTDGTAKFISFSCGALIQKLLTDGNTGIYLMPINPPLSIGNNISSFSSTRYSDTLKRPRLVVVTDVGTFNPSVTVSAWLQADENTLVNAPERLDNRSVLKADLSGVTGTVVSATLTLYNYSGFPYQWGLFYLRMPALIWEPARQLGGVVQGIAADVATDDNDLRGTVLYYPRWDSEANIRADWGQATGVPVVGARNIDFTTTNGWELFGLTAVRMESPAISEGDTLSFRDGAIASMKEAMTADDEIWEGGGDPIGSIEYTEGYYRYLLKVDTDVRDAIDMVNGRGVKLPGMSSKGSYGTLPPQDDGTGYSARLEHRGTSRANPDMYRLVWYLYDGENPTYTGFGAVTPIGQIVVRAGREKPYCIEQYIKMNTLGSLIGPDPTYPRRSLYNATADGILRVWVDGVLSFERTDVLINNTDPRNCLGTIFMNVYHGGVAIPYTPMHYETAGHAFHTAYIGPPKEVAWTPPYSLPGPLGSLAIATNRAEDVYPAGSMTQNSWVGAVYNSFGGGDYVEDYSNGGAYVIAGSGGHDHPENIGALIFDFEDATFKRLDPQGGSYTDSGEPVGYSEADTNGTPYYELTGSSGAAATGVPSPAHPYGHLIAIPTSMGGGSKGSVAYITRMAVCIQARNSLVAHRMDLATGVWSRFSNNSASRGTVEGNAVLDVGRNRAWVTTNSEHSYSRRVYLDFATGNFTDSASESGFPAGAAANGHLFMHGTLVLKMTTAGDLFCYDPDVPELIQLTLTGWTPPNADEGICSPWAWHEGTGKFYKLPYTGGSTLYRMTPPASPKSGTWTVDTVAISPALPSANLGTGPRTGKFFFYVPPIDRFAWIPGEGLNVNVYLINPYEA